MVVCGQSLRVPAQEGWRRLPQVDRDVPDLALEAAYEFHFGVGWSLKVHATYRSLAGSERVIDLDDGFVPSRRPESFGAKQPLKESSRVGVMGPLDDMNSSDRCGAYEHGLRVGSLSRSSGALDRVARR